MPDPMEIYKSRLDAAVTLINRELDRDLNLSRLAQAANFSAFHFHRIFAAVMGQTPQHYLNRLRFEKAANLLIKSRSQSITAIALDCGFSSSATFARAFKNHFGVTASAYRRTPTLPPASEPAATPADFRGEIEITVRTMPALHVAYVSNLGGYAIDLICRAWNQLYRWAWAHELVTTETKSIGISFDDPLITPAAKCRYYACITVPRGTKTRNPIGRLKIPALKCAVAPLACTVDEIPQIYFYLYRNWLIESGYQPADHPPYELYHAIPATAGDGKYVFDVCIPVVPL